ncbi:DUF2207 domain-containing protein [Subtercola endophyticus]|uniref:DUF2207 domain-containing protein n=1 Tax=Subtercola endophyticus TaxID=2895559 RepID=UPI001E48352B|nr:DUF2207 domain-containing protein [Subtercola endophyticus]UFS60661.1 DUF2207 domain-containing protein [Subtercola endophyticus]
MQHKQLAQHLSQIGAKTRVTIRFERRLPPQKGITMAISNDGPKHQMPSRRQQAKKGQFDRPELTTSWQKFSGSVLVRVLAAIILVGGTVLLVILALAGRS